MAPEEVSDAEESTKTLAADSIAQFLGGLEVFSNLSPLALQELSEEADEKIYHAGDLLIKKGDEGDCMFLIVEGEVEVPFFEMGDQKISVKLGEGQIVGEMALLTGEPRVVDVIAFSEVRCLVFKKDEVEALMRKHPEVGRFLTTILGKRLMESGKIQSVGKYTITGQLGKGGMAIVFEGVHPTLGRSVAIKMLSHELVYHENFANQFRVEAQTLAKLRHPNIVEIYDTDEKYATFFIVMEKLVGKDLDVIIRERGRLSPVETRKIVIQLASALKAAHNYGIVHRDVKPSNLIMTEEGEVKLMDFGIAIENKVKEDEKGDRNVVMGTPAFMPPEQIRGKATDARADIYATGVMAYNMLTGEVPFRGPVKEVMKRQLKEEIPSPRAKVSNVPDDLVEFIARACAKKPEDRFQNCDEVLAFLGADEKSDMSQIGVETVTLVYPDSQSEAIAKIVEECRDKASQLPDVIVQ